MTKVPSLINYIQEDLSQLDEKYWHFYAFWDSQFNEAMNPDLETKDYTGTWFWWYLPTKNLESFLKERDALYKKWIEQIKKDFTKKQIMRYTFSNYECYYVWDPTDAIGTLIDFWYTEDEVWKSFYWETVDHS